MAVMGSRLPRICGAVAVVGVAVGLAACGAGSSSPARARVTPPADSVARTSLRSSRVPRRAATVAARLPRVPTLFARPATARAFAIVRLRPGARVSLWRGPHRGFVKTIGPRTEFGSPVVLSVTRVRGNWLGVSTPELGDGRTGWIRRNPGRVQLYWTEYSLDVSLDARSLSLRYGGRRVARFSVTVGGAGSETPLGRFGITDALRFGHSPYYGCCALALSGRQPNLPPGWIGGNRIAIHGTLGAVGRAESSGCIRATDRTMRLLFRLVPLGTPVFVRE
jgi:hypothetical protein